MDWRQLFSRRKRPMFMAIQRHDPELEQAYAHAAATVPLFTSHVLRSGDHMCCAKLRFRDPDRSRELGEDRFVFLWLNSVTYDPSGRTFTGTFFELPPELQKYHSVGEQLMFSSDELFDWFVSEDGRLEGGFTMRVARSRLPEHERANYDHYAGITSWAPLPPQ